MIKVFTDNPTLENRALQIWQILVGFAYQRKTTTYSEIAEILGYEGAGVLDRQLGHILHFCDQKRLPPLTVLVVNSSTGLPGSGFVCDDSIDKARVKVFSYDWFDVIPPSPQEFATAWNNVM